MSDDQKLFYFVSDEMLRQFGKSTIAQRLQWLDEMRTFTWNAQTDATRARWRAEREARHALVSTPNDRSTHQTEDTSQPHAEGCEVTARRRG